MEEGGARKHGVEFYAVAAKWIYTAISKADQSSSRDEFKSEQCHALGRKFRFGSFMQMMASAIKMWYFLYASSLKKPLIHFPKIIYISLRNPHFR